MFRLIKLNLIQLRRRLFFLMIIAVVFALLSFSFATAVYDSFMGDMAQVHLDIAVISEGDENSTLVDFISSLSDVSQYASFYDMDSDAALLALESGELTAVLELPAGFMDSILSGENLPMTLHMDGDMRAESLLVLYAGTVAGDMLISVQQAIYSVIDELAQANALTTAEILKINLEYISFTTSRATMFDTELVSATGDRGIYEHYLSSFLVFILLMTAPLFYPIFNSHIGWKRRLKSIGVTGFTMATTCFLTVFICVLPLSFVAVWLCSAFDILSGLAFALLLASLIYFVCALSKNEVFCSVFAFILTAVMAFLGGAIIPPILLPNSILKILAYVPLSALRELCFGNVQSWAIVFALGLLAIAMPVFARGFDRREGV